MKLEKTVMVPKTITVTYDIFDGETIPEYRRDNWDRAFIEYGVLNLEFGLYPGGRVFNPHLSYYVK